MKVLFLYLGKKGEKKSAFFDAEAKKSNIDVTARSIPNHKGKRSVFLSALTTPLDQKKYDAIVTTEYFLAFAINLRLFLFGKKVKHIIYGLNQSARLLRFSNTLLNRLISKIFNQADWVVTHSRAEMRLFHQVHDIDQKKFVFSHWGFDLPKIKEDFFSGKDKPYLSFVGRNNRDIHTFCEAIKGLDIDGVVITSKNNAPKFSVPDNVELHYDLNMDACISCMRHAVINVVLVNDDERGAGHITIVASMLMKKPQIISDVSVVKEYFVDSVHGVSVPIGDHVAVKKAINFLRSNQDASEYAEQAYQYANKYFTNTYSSKRLVAILNSVYANAAPDACEPQWFEEYQAISQV
ncbi:hypothetical protein ACVBE9_06485 [Eionea flava]